MIKQRKNSMRTRHQEAYLEVDYVMGVAEDICTALVKQTIYDRNEPYPRTCDALSDCVFSTYHGSQRETCHNPD